MGKLWGRGGKLRFAVYTACLAAFLFFGYDQGVLSGLLENEYFQEQFQIPSDAVTGQSHRLYSDVFYDLTG